MSSPMQLRHALRRLIKRPGFTVTAVLSLAIGIGANTAIFSLIDTIVLRDKAFADPTGLVELYPMEDQSYGTFSYPEFQVLRRGTENVFSQLAASQMTLVQLAGETAVDTVVGELVSGDYFPILGLDAALGRTLLPEDDLRPGGHPVVVLSHQYWQQRYGGQEDVVGRAIRLSGYPFTVVGVAPATYQGNFRGIAPSFYIPFQMINQVTPVAADEDGLQQWGNHSLFVRARIAPGSTLQGARAAVDGVAAELRESYSAYWSPDHRIRLMASEDVILFPPIDRFLRASAWLLMTVVGLVLLITCANLASFLLAQATDRRKEMALRLALGAQRRNIVGKLLAESMLLSTLGGLGGIGLGIALLRLLGSADLPLPLPIALDLGMNPKVLLFSIGVTLLAGILFGLSELVLADHPHSS